MKQSRSNLFDWHFAAYNASLILALPAVMGYAAWRIAFSSRARGGWAERFGILPRIPDGGPRIWVHAVSAGEMNAAMPVCSALLDAVPEAQLLLSTTTPTGRQVAVRNARKAAAIFYFPVDLWPCVTRALHSARPSLCVLLEKELWPNFLVAARSAGVPVAVVNARISDRTMRRSNPVGGFLTWAVRLVDLFAAQSESHRQRLIAVGADPASVVVCGNVKFDQGLKPLTPGQRKELRAAIGLGPDPPLIVAGSTHPGEEEALLAAFRAVKQRIPDARLLIAPRHIERAPQVEQLITQRGFRCLRRTRAAGKEAGADTVIMLDTMGELGRFYGLGDVAFVGGTLVPIGGHDLLQPLAHGLPVVFGSYVHTVTDLAEALLDAGIGFQVSTAEELGERFYSLLSDEQKRLALSEKAASFLARHSGAARRCAEAAAGLLKKSPGRSHAAAP